MAITKIVDDMRTTVALDATKLAGTVPIANDSITLAKMASGTDGQVITYSAAGDPVAIGPGTAGQVLTSAGANLPQTFADAAGGGAWTKIGTSVANDSVSLTVSGIDNTYSNYAFMISDMRAAANAETIRFRFGNSGGIDSSTNYAYHQLYTLFSGGSAGSSNHATNHIAIGNKCGNALGYGNNIIGYFNSSTDSGQFPMIHGHWIGAYNTGDTHGGGGLWGGRLKIACVVTQMQIYIAGANMTSGRFTVWGISHA